WKRLGRVTAPRSTRPPATPPTPTPPSTLPPRAWRPASAPRSRGGRRSPTCPADFGEAAPVEDHELTSRSFTAWPAWAELPLDVVAYGPDIATEAELRLLGRLDGKRVLELGCGGGPVSVAMTKQGAKVIAVESSAEQPAHARRLCEREEVAVE